MKLSIMRLCVMELVVHIILVAAASLALYYNAYSERSPATDRLLGYCLLSTGAVTLSTFAFRLVWAKCVSWRMELLTKCARGRPPQQALLTLRAPSDDGRVSPFEVALGEVESCEESVREEAECEKLHRLCAAVVSDTLLDDESVQVPAIARSLLTNCEKKLFVSVMAASKELEEARAFVPHRADALLKPHMSASPTLGASISTHEPVSARLRRVSVPGPTNEIAQLMFAIKSPELHSSRTSSAARPQEADHATVGPTDASPPPKHPPFDSNLSFPAPTSSRLSPHLSPKIWRRVKSTFRPNVSTAACESNQPMKDSHISRGTVMVVDIRGFSADEDVPDESELHSISGSIGRILIIIAQHGGVVYRFDTQKIVATFHVQMPCPEHSQMCVFAALEISKFLEEYSQTLTFGIGIAAGHFISGDVGTAELRSLVVVGRALRVAEDLAVLNYELQTRILLTDSVRDEVQTCMVTMLVDFIGDEHVPQRGSGSVNCESRKPFCVFEVRSDAPDADDEPSPKFPGCRQLPHEVLVTYLEAFFMLRSGEFAKAVDHLKAAKEFLTKDPQLRRLERLAKFCASNEIGASDVPCPYYRRKYKLWDEVESDFVDECRSPDSNRGPSPSYTRRSRQLHDSPTRIIEAVIRARSSTPGQLDEDTLTSQPSGFMNLSTDFVDVNGVVWRKSDHTLGRGNFGEVFLGLRPDDGKLVAMKQLKIPNLVAENGDVARGRRSAKKAQDELEALVSEIRLLCQLRHPNIVYFLGCAVVSHDIIINLEYVSGGSLQSMLRSFGSLPMTTVQRYVKDILRGLQFLHSKDIVHLDLKPANVLLHVDGSCKVTDFGTSIQMHKILDSNLVVGTPLYMSPEQAKGVKHCSFPTDLWSLGMTVIELLCGQLPFAADVNPFVHMRRLAFDETFRVEIPEELPSVAHSFVSQCLQRDPQKRGSCDELLMHSFLFSSASSHTPSLRLSKSHALGSSMEDARSGSASQLASPHSANAATASQHFPPRPDLSTTGSMPAA